MSTARSSRATARNRQWAVSAGQESTLVVVHHGTDPIRQRLSRAVSPCWRAQSLQQLTISVHETLGPGGTEARAFLAGILATATVAGQTQTYAPSLTPGAYPSRTLGVPQAGRDRSRRPQIATRGDVAAGRPCQARPAERHRKRVRKPGGPLRPGPLRPKLGVPQAFLSWFSSPRWPLPAPGRGLPRRSLPDLSAWAHSRCDRTTQHRAIVATAELSIAHCAIARLPLCRQQRGPTHTRPTPLLRKGTQVVGSDYGAGSGSAFAELNACTPASLSPSNGVTGLFGPRQKSSSLGSANHIPTRFRSTRTRLPLTSVDENASWTIRWNRLGRCPRRWC